MGNIIIATHITLSISNSCLQLLKDQERNTSMRHDPRYIDSNAGIQSAKSSLSPDAFPQWNQPLTFALYML